MRILIFLLATLISSSVFSQGMELNEKLTWAEVLKKAKTEGKPIFVDAYTTWCGPCKWMAKNVFPSDSAGKFYNGNFISYKLDMEKGEGIQFAKKYEVKFFPTYLFFDKDGYLVHRSGGSKPVHAFISDGRNALDPDRQLVTLSKRFADDPTNKKIVMNYARALNEAGETSPEVAEAFFNVASDEEKLSNEAFNIFSQQSDIKSPSFAFMKTNRTKFVNVTEKEAGQAIHARYETQVISLGIEKNYDGFTAYQEAIETDLGKLAWKELLLLYYGAAKDHSNKLKAAGELFSDPGFNDANILNSIAWYVYETPSATEEELKSAMEWSKRSITISKEYAYLDTYASVLYRLKKYDEARTYAKEAIALAEANKEDAKATVELLNLINKESGQAK